MLGQIIFGTKCDRDKPLLSPKRGDQADYITLQNRDQSGELNVKIRGQSAEIHSHFQVFRPICHQITYF